MHLFLKCALFVYSAIKLDPVRFKKRSDHHFNGWSGLYGNRKKNRLAFPDSQQPLIRKCVGTVNILLQQYFIGPSVIERSVGCPRN